MSARRQKVISLIQQEIATLINQDFYSERFGLVTVTAVEITPNLSTAHVFVHSTRNRAGLPTALDKHRHQWNQTLNHKLSMRRPPRLIFHLDQSIEKAARIDELLKQSKN